MFAATKTLSCHAKIFELSFVVYKAAYKQFEVPMPKNEPKDPKSHEKIPEAKKSQKKIDLAIIKIEPSSPIQEVMCREEHKKLFEGLCERKQWL